MQNTRAVFIHFPKDKGMNSTSTKPTLRTESFNGLPIVFREDGYINMTKAAKHFGKRLQHFTESPDTLEYVLELEANTGIRCLVAKRGGSLGQSGTWCHPKLAVKFACWLSVEFEAWCHLMIDNILKGHLVVDVAAPTQEAQQLRETLNQALTVIHGLEAEKEALKGEVKRLQEEQSTIQ